MSTTTISISTEHLALLRQYAQLSGTTAKAAAEYAIDQVLVGEIEDYFMASDLPEVDRLTKAANALLPKAWRLNVALFGNDASQALIGVNLGLDGVVPTYINSEEAQAVRHSLYDMPTGGGSFRFGGEHVGAPVLVRRQGQGILFQLCDNSTGMPSGPRTTIASKSAYRIAMALDLAIAGSGKLSGGAV